MSLAFNFTSLISRSLISRNKQQKGSPIIDWNSRNLGRYRVTSLTFGVEEPSRSHRENLAPSAAIVPRTTEVYKAVRAFIADSGDVCSPETRNESASFGSTVDARGYNFICQLAVFAFACCSSMSGQLKRRQCPALLMRVNFPTKFKV